jgi:hypothetical protein
MAAKIAFLEDLIKIFVYPRPKLQFLRFHLSFSPQHDAPVPELHPGAVSSREKWACPGTRQRVLCLCSLGLLNGLQVHCRVRECIVNNVSELCMLHLALYLFSPCPGMLVMIRVVPTSWSKVPSNACGAFSSAT